MGGVLPKPKNDFALPCHQPGMALGFRSHRASVHLARRQSNTAKSSGQTRDAPPRGASSHLPDPPHPMSRRLAQMCQSLSQNSVGRPSKFHSGQKAALDREVRIPTMPPTYSDLIAPTIPS
jgi:hypothetical protein